MHSSDCAYSCAKLLLSHSPLSLPLSALLRIISAESAVSLLTLVERVVCVGLEEEVLEAHHDAVEVEHGLPVFAQDVEAYVAL